MTETETNQRDANRVPEVATLEPGSNHTLSGFQKLFANTEPEKVEIPEVETVSCHCLYPGNTACLSNIVMKFKCHQN